MNEIAEFVKSALICPFTGHDLVELTEKEITLINNTISQGIYCFHHGAPLNVKLEKAFVCSTNSYVYPIFDDIIFLKKATAIVPKNRTLDPNKRVSKESAEAFYEKYGFGDNYEVKAFSSSELRNPLTLEQVSDLGKLLPKSGKSFVSIITHDVDSIHNLAYGRNFDQFVHLDVSLKRLKSVVNELKEGTLYVLADANKLPLKDHSVGALFSFGYINSYDKSDQKWAYDELKRCMSDNGASVVLYEAEKPMHAKGKLVTDLISKKALRFVAPWKNEKSLDIYFYPVGSNQSEDHQIFFSKTSLSNQFS